MTIAELRNEEHYIELLALRHDDIIPFVQDVFANRRPIIQLYIALNIALLLGLIIVGIWQAFQEVISGWTILKYAGLGLTLGLLPLIPVHEWIHGLAYKFVGAPKVTYGANLKKFYFYAVADHFVVKSSEFRIIALAPFVIINILVIVATFFVSIEIQWFLLGVLLIHTAACSSDFAMLSYYSRYKEEEIYTFDDVKGKISYFYRKRIT